MSNRRVCSMNSQYTLNICLCLMTRGPQRSAQIQCSDSVDSSSTGSLHISAVSPRFARHFCVWEQQSVRVYVRACEATSETTGAVSK